MEKIDYKNLEATDLICRSNKAYIYKLKNGDILKIFHPFILDLYKKSNLKLEEKIISAKPFKTVPEIIVPKISVYDDNQFIGYTCKEATGIDYNSYDDTLSENEFHNLNRYAKEYEKLEDIIKRGNKEKIVFPDFCTCDNIFIDKKGNFSLIDYDGLQIGDFITPVLSSSLGNQEQYNCFKYQRNNLFTPEIDKKSLITLYFLSAFNVDINKAETLNPITREIVTLDDIFEMIGLDDYDVQNKVWKLFQDNKQNEFLGEDVFRIAENYDLLAIPIAKNTYIKRLIKK